MATIKNHDAEKAFKNENPSLFANKSANEVVLVIRRDILYAYDSKKQKFSLHKIRQTLTKDGLKYLFEEIDLLSLKEKPNYNYFTCPKFIIKALKNSEFGKQEAIKKYFAQCEQFESNKQNEKNHIKKMQNMLNINPNYLLKKQNENNAECRFVRFYNKTESQIVYYYANDPKKQEYKDRLLHFI